MSTVVNGLIIDRIEDEDGNDVSNTDEWRGYEFTLLMTQGYIYQNLVVIYVLI